MPTKRKDGRWCDYAVDPATKKRLYVYARTEKECKQKIHKLRYELEEGLHTGSSNMTVKALLELWFATHKKNLAETTVPLYQMYIDKHLVPRIGSKKLKAIKGLDLDRCYLDLIESGLSPNTVSKLHNVIRQAFKYAAKNGIIAVNPALAVSTIRKKPFRPTIYTDEQFNTLMDAVKGTKDELPILLAGGLGLRRGEVFGLRWEDIDFDKGLISIKETQVRYDKYVTKAPKTETSQRTVRAPQFLMDVLLERYQTREDARVCPEYKPDSWSKHFAILLERLGLPKTRYHDLRHYNATLMVRYGVPDIVAAERLGHCDTTMLKKVYQHVMDDMREDAAQRMDAAFDTPFDTPTTDTGTKNDHIRRVNTPVTQIDKYRKTRKPAKTADQKRRAALD